MTVKFGFDNTNPDAQKAALDQAARMVTGISAETEKAIRVVIAQAIRDGVPPYEAAVEILPLIGLTSPQAQAVQNYRDQLEGSGLAGRKIEEKVNEYADQLLEARADAIARTEIMDALNEGQQAAWLQAQDDGVLTEGATKEWITTPDELTCDDCAPMDGKTVPIDSEFDGGDPPLHPNCRCTIAIGTP